MKQTKVSVNLQQDFTTSEKAQARDNIGAVSSTELAAGLATKQDVLTAATMMDMDREPLRSRTRPVQAARPTTTSVHTVS